MQLPVETELLLQWSMGDTSCVGVVKNLIFSAEFWRTVFFFEDWDRIMYQAI